MEHPKECFNLAGIMDITSRISSVDIGTFDKDMIRSTQSLTGAGGARFEQPLRGVGIPASSARICFGDHGPTGLSAQDLGIFQLAREFEMDFSVNTLAPMIESV
jgi:hypothetical protein